MALPSMEPDPNDPTSPAGVQPGFYLIRITKEGVDIPAKYNTETTFGMELAHDTDIMMKPIEFRMD